MHRTVHRASRLVFAAAMFLVLVPSVRAGTTGKLSGVVTTEKKEPLPGVNVRIVGQRLGAITDEQGRYSIIGILGGQSYAVTFNLMEIGRASCRERV